MKTFSRRSLRDYRVRNFCLVATGLLFLLSVAELVLRASGDVSIWRGLALSSLYLSFCLMQRRLFVPSSRAVAKPRRQGQLLD